MNNRYGHIGLTVYKSPVGSWSDEHGTATWVSLSPVRMKPPNRQTNVRMKPPNRQTNKQNPNGVLLG